MTVWEWLDLVGDILFLLTTIASVAFVGLYLGRSQWRATSVGRVTARFMTTLAIILVVSIMFSAVEQSDVRDHVWAIIRLVLWSSLLTGMMNYIVVLLRAQREVRSSAGETDKDREEPDSC